MREIYRLQKTADAVATFERLSEIDARFAKDIMAQFLPGYRAAMFKSAQRKARCAMRLRKRAAAIAATIESKLLAEVNI